MQAEIRSSLNHQNPQNFTALKNKYLKEINPNPDSELIQNFHKDLNSIKDYISGEEDFLQIIHYLHNQVIHGLFMNNYTQLLNPQLESNKKSIHEADDIIPLLGKLFVLIDEKKLHAIAEYVSSHLNNLESQMLNYLNLKDDNIKGKTHRLASMLAAAQNDSQSLVQS